MDGQNTIITHYAILIGIDDYLDKPLKSCVNDVQNIKKFLKGTLKEAIKLWAIIASQADRQLPDEVQDSTLWPTRENVTLAFERVISLARAGDYVYIHYSGHGTQKPPSGDFSNKPTGDLALVLLSGGKVNRQQYFWGFELASLLNKMVDKGLVVTLILDCCFSGSVYRRDDPSVRFLSYDPEYDSDYLLDPKKNIEDRIYRDISMQPNWLIRPDRYAILTACGPHEETMGVKFDGKSYGALSYFLLKTVERVGITRRHGDIHDHLRAKFQGSGLRHTLALYGNRNQGFFGQVTSEIIEADIPIIVRQDGTLELQAGYAHGVMIDDRLVLYPLDCAEGDPRSQGHSVTARVTGTRALTSELKLSDTLSIPIQTGWMAKALTRLALQKFRIRLAFELPRRDEWLKALRDRSLNVYVDTENYLFAVDVVLNDGRYEIPNEAGYEIIDLTSIPQDQTGIGQVGSILEHLARFRLVRDLINKVATDPFRESFEVQIVGNGKSFDPDFLIEMEHNAIVELMVENKGDKDLFIFVYDLGPCWQVKNALCGTNIVVRPQNNGRNTSARKKLRMMIPKQMREKGYRSCKDILKVFVTSQPTSFDLLELPRLGERAKKTAADRTGRAGGDGLENWAAVNFPIHISLQKDISI